MPVQQSREKCHIFYVHPVGVQISSIPLCLNIFSRIRDDFPFYASLWKRKVTYPFNYKQSAAYHGRQIVASWKIRFSV